jgi:hypothetical protein
MPGFFVGVVFRACHGRIQADRRHSSDYFFGEDVPDVFGNYVGRYEIKRIFLVDMVAGSDRALVATVLLADCGLDLHPEDSRALVVHQEIVSGWFSPRPGRAQSFLDGPQCEAHLGPCSAVFGILDVHTARFFHTVTLFHSLVVDLSECAPTKNATSGGRTILGTYSTFT